MGLEQLLPEYQAQYYALEPEIERSVRKASNARGVYYSGASVDEEARAKADLLARLAAESAATRASREEKAKDREAARSESSAGRRSALAAAALGTGGGALATLGTLAYLNKAGGGQLVPLADGRIGVYKNGVLSELPIKGGAGQAAEGGLPALQYDPATGKAAFGAAQGAEGGLPPLRYDPATGKASMGAAAPASGAGAQKTSFFKQPAGWKQLLAGTAGGVAGSEIGKLAFGSSMGGDIGAAGGGLAGFAAGMKYGNSPYAALAGAGIGAFGGRGLGQLFR